jgi:hypothetical protein
MLDNYDVKYDTHVLCRNDYLSRVAAEELLSRSIALETTHYKLHTGNKYLQGMMSHLLENDGSVEVIEHTPNDYFDTLLSENIVFLNLTDASACNTVVECIVRNTPIIINRLPALEEVLGVDYPGFYDSDDMFTPTSMILDIQYITRIYEYLKKLDKRRFTLDAFMQDFQDKLCRLIV